MPGIKIESGLPNLNPISSVVTPNVETKPDLPGLNVVPLIGTQNIKVEPLIGIIPRLTAFRNKVEHKSPDSSTQRPPKQIARNRSQPQFRLPPYKAVIKTLAGEVNLPEESPAGSTVDNAVLQRIKKCLILANHETTNEAEAKAALFLASQMMSRHNITQAEVLAQESPETRQNFAGQSIVAIVQKDDSLKAVKAQNHVSTLANTIRYIFDCKYYWSKTNYSITYTFYGIIQNTVTAAMAFEMVYNLVAEWARPYRGIATRRSYCLGISNELWSIACREKKEEEKKAKEVEYLAREAQVKQEEAEKLAADNRLLPLPDQMDTSSADNVAHATSPGPDSAPDWVASSPQSSTENTLGSTYDSAIDLDHEIDFRTIFEINSDSEDEGEIKPDFDQEDGDNIDSTADIDATIKQLVKEEPGQQEGHRFADILYLPYTPRDATPPRAEPIKQEPAENATNTSLESTWQSHMQLMTFRGTAKQVAEDYIQDQGVKFSKKKSRAFARTQDQAAYRQGQRDSKKIDVRQKRIQEAPLVVD